MERVRFLIRATACVAALFAGPAAGSALAAYSFTVSTPNPESGAATVTITRSPALLAGKAHVQTSSGTAMSGTDFSAVNQDVDFAATDGGPRTVSIPITADGADEADETFSVAVTTADLGDTVTGSPKTATITDDDPAASVGDLTAGEGSGTASVPVTLSAPAGAGGVTVDYLTEDISATAGSDYTAKSGSVTISAGQTTGSIPVPLTDDGVDETDEAFRVRLTNVPGGSLGDAEGIVTITDDDTASFLIGDVAAQEGNSGTTTYTFPISLSTPSSRTVIGTWTTANVTAVAPGDYTAAAGDLVFAPGETQRTVGVAVVGETLAELDETFVVALTKVSGAAPAARPGVGTVVNDDAGTPVTSSGQPVGTGTGGTSGTAPARDWPTSSSGPRPARTSPPRASRSRGCASPRAG